MVSIETKNPQGSKMPSRGYTREETNIPWITFPAEGLSQQSLMTIIQLLAEDLRLAKKRIVELMQTNASSCQNNFCTDRFHHPSQSETDMKILKENQQANQFSCNWLSMNNPSLEPTEFKEYFDQQPLVEQVQQQIDTRIDQSKLFDPKGKDEISHNTSETLVENLSKLNCSRCNSRHKIGKECCPAWNKVCHKCRRLNHFAICCKTQKKNYLPKFSEDFPVQETILTNDSTEKHKDKRTQLKGESSRSVRTRRSKSESELQTLKASLPADVAWAKEDETAVNGSSSKKKRCISDDLQAKEFQKN